MKSECGIADFMIVTVYDDGDGLLDCVGDSLVGKHSSNDYTFHQNYLTYQINDVVAKTTLITQLMKCFKWLSIT